MKWVQISLLVVVALAMGCKKIEFQSKTREGHIRPINQVCIVVTHPFNDPDQSKWSKETKETAFAASRLGWLSENLDLRTKESFETFFAARGIQTSVLIFKGPVAANQALLRPALSSAFSKVDVPLLQDKCGFRPSYVLRFNLGSTGTRFYTHGASGIHHLRCAQLSMIELENGLVIWKTELWVKETSDILQDFLSMAELTLQQLEKDGLLKTSGKS